MKKPHGHHQGTGIPSPAMAPGTAPSLSPSEHCSKQVPLHQQMREILEMELVENC